MTKPLVTACPEAGSHHCPCAGAITSNCPVCSLLRGEQKCNCDWPGDCVYYKFMWNDKKIILPQDIENCFVLKKDTSNNFFVTLICIVSEKTLKTLKPYQVCSIISNNPYYSTSAVVVKIFEEYQLVVFAVQDHNIELPLKGSHILNKGTKINIQQKDLIIKIPIVSEIEVLICLDGFWNGILPNILTDLARNDCKITCIGKIENIYHPILKNHDIQFFNINTWKDSLHYVFQEKYKLVLLLNTPLWQRKILDNLWPVKGKEIITVGNDLM